MPSSSATISVQWNHLTQALRDFSTLLTCPLCQSVMTNPYTISECGHTFCHDCVCERMKEKCQCPSCSTPILVRNIKRCPQYSSIISLTLQLHVASCRRVVEANIMAKEVEMGLTPAKRITPLRRKSVTPNSSAKRTATQRTPNSSTKKTPKTEIVPSETSQKTPTLSSTSTMKTFESSTKKSPSVPRRRLTCTGLSVAQKQVLHTTSKKLLTPFTVSLVEDNFDMLLVNSNAMPRTMKLLQAKVAGIPIVRFDEWLLMSITTGHWMPIPERQNPMFATRRFCLQGPFLTPSRSDLVKLISAGGGAIGTRPDPDMTVIYDDKCKSIVEAGSMSVSAFLDSIIRQ